MVRVLPLQPIGKNTFVKIFGKRLFVKVKICGVAKLVDAPDKKASF